MLLYLYDMNSHNCLGVKQTSMGQKCSHTIHPIFLKIPKIQINLGDVILIDYWNVTTGVNSVSFLDKITMFCGMAPV
jgi:hypothetical protein